MSESQLDSGSEVWFPTEWPLFDCIVFGRQGDTWGFVLCKGGIPLVRGYGIVWYLYGLRSFCEMYAYGNELNEEWVWFVCSGFL